LLFRYTGKTHGILKNTVQKYIFSREILPSPPLQLPVGNGSRCGGPYRGTGLRHRSGMVNREGWYPGEHQRSRMISAERKNRLVEILRTILTFPRASPPPLWHPRIAITPYYLVNFEW